MSIQSNEWLVAKELLAQLVQILSPFAQEGEGREKEISSFSQRLFIPPSIPDKNQNFTHTVRLLSTLQQAQKQMNHWIEILSDGKEVLDPQRKSDLSQKAEERNVSSSSQRSENSSKIAQLAQGQAKQVILQVRQALHILSDLPNLQDIKVASFRNAIQKLKPVVEDLIEAVNMPSAEDGMQTSHRKQSLLSIRKQQPPLNKQIPLPFKGKKESATRPTRGFSARIREAKKEDKPQSKTTEKKETILKPEKAKDSSEEKDLKQVPLPAKSQTSHFSGLISGSRDSMPKEGDAPKALPHFDRIAIPGAPFTSTSQMTSNSSSKAKKKRKKFWQRGEDDEEDDEEILKR